MKREARVVLSILWLITWAFMVPFPALVMSMVFKYNPTPIQWFGAVGCLIIWTVFARIVTKISEELSK